MTQRKWSGRIEIRVAWLVAAFIVLLAPLAARAEQFVLFDVMFTYTKMDADTSTPSRSHFYVMDNNGRLNRNRPTNWLTPVDYRNGSVHIRLEVIDKPVGSEITQWTLCYIPNRGVPGGGGYGCTGTGTYREEGIYEQNVSMTSWWQNTAIDYAAGIRQMDLVMKDSNGGGGFTNLRPDPERFFPTTVRITMVQVSAGSTYNAALVPGLGAGAAPADAGAPRDTAPSVDAPVAAADAGAAPTGQPGSDAAAPAPAPAPSGTGGAGGASGAGGEPGSGSAPTPGTGGRGGSPPPNPADPTADPVTSSCACSLTARGPSSGAGLALALLALGVVRTYRRRRRADRAAS